ncbi:MAG: hypothetical protein AAFX44_06185 [Pseudomonadota bacterium]
MRLTTLLLATVVVSGCATGYEPTFPSTEGAESETLHVLPVLHQEELAVQVVVADSSAATAQYGALGALVGAIVDSAVNNSRAKQAERKAEVLRQATADYRIMANFQEAIATDSAGRGWSVENIGPVSAEPDVRDQVKDVFASSGVDTVVVLTATYEMVPSLDQVSVSIAQEVYPRPDSGSTSRPKASSQRTFAYQSPYREVEYRSFVEGEKDLIKASITREYEQSITTQPDEEKDLRKALAKELEELDEATEIPEDIAIKETWPANALADYLDEAKSHLRYMIEFDWNERIVPEVDKEALDEFYVVNALGVRAKTKGRKIAELDGNVVYRASGGPMYSVPPAEIE